MNLDALHNRQRITVQDADLRAGQETHWTRPRGTRVYLSTLRVHPGLGDICISIAGSGVFSAAEYDAQLQALVGGTRPGRATRILGVSGPWRQIRHPLQSGGRMARPIQRGPTKPLP